VALERCIRTISSRTSPAVNDSPSFFFHDVIPPSVMVGLIAGIANFDSTFLRTELCRPVTKLSTVLKTVDKSYAETGHGPGAQERPWW
jgi:hypothetical protein